MGVIKEHHSLYFIMAPGVSAPTHRTLVLGLGWEEEGYVFKQLYKLKQNTWVGDFFLNGESKFSVLLPLKKVMLQKISPYQSSAANPDRCRKPQQVSVQTPTGHVGAHPKGYTYSTNLCTKGSRDSLEEERS